MARAEHHSLVGTAWREESCQVIGEDQITGYIRLVMMPDGHFKCRYCSGELKIVRMDSKSLACCENCGVVYNDRVNIETPSSNREKKRKSEKLKYDSRHYIP